MTPRESFLPYDGIGPYGQEPPHRGVDTSQAAAQAIAPRVSELQGRVLEFIRQRGEFGATIDEISVGLPMPVQTVCGRRRELFLMGRLVYTGTKRPTRTGSPARVWKAVA